MKVFLKKFEEGLIGICLLSISLLIFLDILLRYLWKRSIFGIEEICILFFTYLIFFGAVVGTREGSHIEVDTIFKILSRRGQLTAALISECLIFIFLMALTMIGVKLVIAHSVFTSASFKIPMSVFSLPLPVCSALMMAYTAKRIWDLWTRRTQEGAKWLE